jgi:hypothetical protein
MGGGGMKRAILLVSLSFLGTSSCQKSECDAIVEHAEDCHALAGAPKGKNGGICEQYRTLKGKAGMADFAQCVTRLRCDDKAGLNTCINNATNSDAPPCERLNGYLVACGLEPASGGLQCTEYGGAETTPAFAGYVQCVIDKGCLNETDAAASLDACRNTILGNAAATLSACQRVANRAQACGEMQPTLATCSLQVAPFTAASVDKWADCYVQASCGDVMARATCTTGLEVATPTSGMTDKNALACSKVSVFQLRCNLRTLPVIGDPSTCQQSLAGFTEQSANDFGDCLKGTDCMDAPGLLTCAGKLRVQTTSGM